jgi:hypothetical protein
MLLVQTSCPRVRVEIVQGVPAIQTEANDNDPVDSNVLSNPVEHERFGVRRDECQNVSRQHCCVERFTLGESGEVEFGEVAHQPPRAGMVGLSGLDELRVDIDADDGVPSCGQFSPDPTGPAAGIENACSTREHGIDQPRLAGEVYTLG